MKEITIIQAATDKRWMRNSTATLRMRDKTKAILQYKGKSEKF